MRKKIGILTFHYVANYGAVLQCYALQTYLQGHGYEVEVINYKPWKNEDSIYNFFRFWKFKNFTGYVLNRKREKALRVFRKERLAIGEEPLRTMRDVQRHVKGVDVLISGSDQVFTPSALLYSEAYGGKGSPCPVYFLGFPFSGKKIAYAVSCGVTQYPEPQLSLAREYIHSFDKISVRENSGVDIVAAMGRTDAVLVPDPTFLHAPSFYHAIADLRGEASRKSYVYNFFIRDIECMRNMIANVHSHKEMLWNNDDDEYSMEGWLNKIKYADFVITDSFHCMVMCLKLHTPFAVITKLKGKVGMNDRFYTILELLGMEQRIVYKDNMQAVENKIKSPEPVRWEQVDEKLAEYAQVGARFLDCL